MIFFFWNDWGMMGRGKGSEENKIKKAQEQIT